MREGIPVGLDPLQNLSLSAEQPGLLKQSYQQTYFVIDSFADLLRQTLETDFAPLYADLATAEELAPEAVEGADKVLHLGRQTHA